jgi:hypothetical protein
MMLGTTGHAGYLVSQRQPKRIEEISGWLKQIGRIRKTRHRAAARVDGSRRMACLPRFSVAC